MSIEREWLSVAEIAALKLPAIPHTRSKIFALAEREGWQRPEWHGAFWRLREGRGGGVEYHLHVLPTQARLRALALLNRPEKAAAAPLTDPEREALWRRYAVLDEGGKARAARRATAIDLIEQLAGRMGRVAALQAVCREIGVRSLSTLYQWQRRERDAERGDRLAVLADATTSRTPQAECDPAAWEMLCGLYLRLARPSLTSCLRDVRAAAAQRGWLLPADRTLRRRIAALPREIVTLARQGEEAVRRAIPAQQRSRGHFGALEAVNADGHRFDVFVRWPDGTIGRPLMVSFQDLYSGMLLAWRVDRAESKDLVRLCFGDVVEEWGIPDRCWLDNGRAFASKWLTGGTPTRYRFKVRDEDPQGLLTLLGVEVHWTTPYHGQAKPIERAFRDLADTVSKDVRFDGAWTGNNPTAKPEDYGSKAIPIDDFLAVLAERICEHNGRKGRRTEVCRGQLSFAEAFKSSYESRPIHKGTAAQRAMWLLAAEQVTLRGPSGAVHLMGNRYWHEALAQHVGEKVTVRFDPQNLGLPVQIYRANGRFLSEAAAIEAVRFDDVEAAKEHARRVRRWTRTSKEQLALFRTLDPAQLGQLLAKGEPLPAPAAQVVRPVFGTRGNAALSAAEDEEFDAKLARGRQMLRQIRAHEDD